MPGREVFAPLYPLPTRQRGWVLDRLTAAGLVGAATVLFAVPGGMLWMIGYNYDGLTGGGATKIHPFTYMIMLLFAWRAVSSANPVGYVVHLANVRPASLLMIAASALLFVYVVLRQAPGMAGVIDTFIGPALLMLLLSDADGRLLAKLETVLHGIMTTNALLAMGEFATKTLVFPYRFDGIAFDDPRSTALQGHPLANAAVTCFYVLALLSSGRPASLPLRAVMIGLQCMALVAFGGRSALVLTLILGGAYGGYLVLKMLKGGRIHLLYAAAGAVMLALLPIAVGGLAAAGFFTALLERFVSDGGSANARLEMLELFKYFSWRDLIVGPDVSLVDNLRRVHGLALGIENPVVNMVLYNGAFMMLLMAVALVLLLMELVRNCRAGPWLPILAFALLVNTFESISSKTTLIAKFVIIIVCLYRVGQEMTAPPRHRVPASRPKASRTDGSNSRVTSSIMPIPSKRSHIAQGNPKDSALSRTSRR
jgi:hypothetical protein